MDYGNNGVEFNWGYVGGGGQNNHERGAGQGMSGYPQRQMNHYGGYGGGQQWMHSNQANHSYQHAVPHSTQSAPFGGYNPMAVGYGDVHKSGASGMGQMGMNGMNGNYGSYSGGMNRNGLYNGSMCQNTQSGYGNW